MIKGLTDRKARFPRLGIIRKGAPKAKDSQRPGADLSYFRFVSNDKAVQAKFLEIYGEKPADINIFLPYETVEENFLCWREEWVQGGLLHRCDGERTVLYLDKSTNQYITDPHKQMACPGKCEPVGRLQVIIPELRRYAFIEVITNSKWDIISIIENLESAYIPRRDLRGIPFVLKRRPRKISTPAEKGQAKRIMREKSLLSIEIAPFWVEKHLSQMERLALPDVEEPLEIEHHGEETEEHGPVGTNTEEDEIPMDFPDQADVDDEGATADGPMFSPDDDEQELALRLHDLVLEIHEKSGDEYETVLKRITRKTPTGGGVREIRDLFQFKGIDNARHGMAMERLRKAVELADGIVHPPADLPF